MSSPSFTPTVVTSLLLFFYIFCSVVVYCHFTPTASGSAIKNDSSPTTNLEAPSENHLYSTTERTSPIYKMTAEEFKDHYLSSYDPVFAPERSKWTSLQSMNLTLRQQIPNRWDWRDKGFVTPMKNQNKCGGCWAFAVTETVESMFAITKSKMAEPLSLQEVIDCSNYCYGCSGGSTCGALSWLAESLVPIGSESQYPLTDTSEQCSLRSINSSGVTVTKFACLNPISDESQLLSFLYFYGPVIAAVDANTWNEYMGGIIQYHCGEAVNHAVQIVGYDMSGPVPYYIVRNSWGPGWGHDGYIYLRIGTNTCGIANGINVVLSVKESPGL